METMPIELDGELSPPIRVEALDVFPPAVPQGLAAVAIAADARPGTAAVHRPELAAQYRSLTLPATTSTAAKSRPPWQRISGDQPVVGPAFHDDHVLPGHTYRYSVSAVDKRRPRERPLRRGDGDRAQP